MVRGFSGPDIRRASKEGAGPLRGQERKMWEIVFLVTDNLPYIFLSLKNLLGVVH